MEKRRSSIHLLLACPLVVATCLSFSAVKTLSHGMDPRTPRPRVSARGGAGVQATLMHHLKAMYNILRLLMR
jgi:hypothetical protein